MAEPSQPQQPLDVDESHAPAFSDYGSEVESDTQSLTSSIMEQYFEQNGRRYHTYYGPNKNPLPSDAVEQERLDMFHEMFYLVCNSSVHQAPVANNLEIQNVLDLGTGTGIWAIDFAQENPHSNVIGIDLTPIQPGWVPPNCQFEIDDFELDWTFKQRFDYVHARLVCQSVGDWHRLIRQIHDNMNPGGWVELAEIQFELMSDDNSIPADWPPKVAFSLVGEGVEKMGRVSPTREKMLNYVQQAGFVNIHARTFKVPTGPWPKDPSLKQAGALCTLASKTGYEAYLLAIGTRVLGMSEEEVIALCKRCHEEHLNLNSGVHSYFQFVGPEAEGKTVIDFLSEHRKQRNRG